jgi:MFS family permease
MNARVTRGEVPHRGTSDCEMTPSNRDGVLSLIVRRILVSVIWQAGVLIELPLGSLYTWGNLNPYVTSYMRSFQNIEYADTVWVLAAAVAGQSVVIALGGIIEKKWGPRVGSILGGSIFVAAVALTYFTASMFPAFIITYGLLFGIGGGIAYTSPLVCGACFPCAHFTPQP